MSDIEGDFEKMINSMNILLTSYGFVINLFPASQQLQEKSYKNVMLSVVLALAFCFASYMMLTLLVINVYGEQNVEKNLFDNLTGESNVLSLGIRVIFMVIFLNNIPFLFYPGKLSVLNAMMEYRFNYFSKELKNKVGGN